MSEPAAKLYYSISEVSEEAGVKAHVLRYWETQFSMLRPKKSRGGVRMYRPKDLELIQEIKALLYGRGFTIAGARKKLLSERRRAESVVSASGPDAEASGRTPTKLLREIRRELGDLQDRLSGPPRKRRR